MRAVPDTNVLVSAIVFGGPPGKLIELAAEGYLRLIISAALIDEFREVLRRKFGFSDAATCQAEVLLRRISVVVEPQREVTIIREDAEDNRALEAALAATLRLSFQAIAICSVWGHSRVYQFWACENFLSGFCLTRRPGG